MLQEKQIRRVGSNKPKLVSIPVISASDHDMGTLMEKRCSARHRAHHLVAQDASVQHRSATGEAAQALRRPA
jgi:transcriptional regulator with GAF, ATPase, and Fis domain